MNDDPYYKVLDKLAKTGVCMYAAAPELNKAFPEFSRLHCNKIVLDWINERSYYAHYTQNTETC